MTAPTGESTAAPGDLLAGGSLAGSWTLHPTRSTVTLRSRSLWGALKIKGAFGDVSGAGTVTASGAVSGTLSVATASIDTKIRKRDEHLRSDDFFASETYPAITFTLEKAGTSGSQVTASGTLTVRGRSRLEQAGLLPRIGHRGVGRRRVRRREGAGRQDRLRHDLQHDAEHDLRLQRRDGARRLHQGLSSDPPASLGLHLDRRRRAGGVSRKGAGGRVPACLLADHLVVMSTRPLRRVLPGSSPAAG